MNLGIKRLLARVQFVLTDPRVELAPSARSVLLAVVIHADDDWVARPTQKRLVTITGLHTDTVRDAFRRFRALGLTFTLSTGRGNGRGHGFAAQLRLFPELGFRAPVSNLTGGSPSSEGGSQPPPQKLRLEHYQAELPMPASTVSTPPVEGGSQTPPNGTSLLESSILVGERPASNADTEQAFCTQCTGVDRHTDVCPKTYLERRHLLQAVQ